MRKKSLPFGLDIACCTEPGPARPQNEDACALPPPWADPDGPGTLLAVADGVGGVPGGGEASRDAVGFLQALYYAPAGPGSPGERLTQAVRAVNGLNRRSPQRSTDNERLTTLVAAVIRGSEVWVANVGDSRAYLCPAGARPLKLLTQDHTGSESRAITQAIGLRDECQVDLYHYTWEPGDALVLCSDGLAALPKPELAALAQSLPAAEAAAALVRQAAALDGSDNATAIVARWGRGRKVRAAAGRPAPSDRRDTIPARANGRAGSKRSRFGLGLLLGLLLGWLTAALVVYAAAVGAIPGF